MADTLQRLLIRLEANTEQLQREMRKANKATDRFSKNTKKSFSGIQKSFRGLGNAAKGFAAIYVASLTKDAIKNTILLADNMGMLEDRIKSATRETGGFKDVWDGLLATSLKTGSSLDASVSLFQRLAFTQKELGATNKDMVKLNDIIAKLGVISGATNEQLKNGTLQLSQGLGEGIFRAQEFNSVLENMPAVLNAIARSMGITVSEMRRLVKDGKLLSKDVFAAILEQGKQVDKEFSEIPPRVARAWSKIGTAVSESINKINKELRITSALARVLEGISITIEPKTKLEELNLELQRIIQKINILKISNVQNPFSTFNRMLREATEQMAFINDQREKEFARLAKAAPPEQVAVAVGRKPIDIDPFTTKKGKGEDRDAFLARERRNNELLEQSKINAAETKKILDELSLDALRASGKVVESIRAEAAAEIATFKERVDAGKSSTEDLAQFRILKNKEVSAELKKIADKDMERMNKAAKDFGEAMAQSFESRGIEAILNGDLSGALKGLIRDFAAMALRLAILKPLAESLFKSTGGGSIFGSIFKSLVGAAAGGKAGGGDISGPTLVGERGPELFIPKTAGTIRTATDTRRMGGQQTSITQNITVATDVRNTVRAEMFQLFPILEQQLLNSVNQQFAGVRA